MVAVKFLDGFWLLVISVWPLLGSCSNSTGADYKCGEEGVQLLVVPGHLGGEVSFQIRGKFGVFLVDLKCLSGSKCSRAEFVGITGCFCTLLCRSAGDTCV